MRELAKSMFRFSWAMGMLGVDQATQMVSSKDGWRNSSESLDAVSDAASDQLGDTMKGYYKAGEHLGDGLAETASKAVSSDWTQPGKAMNATWESLDRTWSDLRADLSDSGVPKGEA